jgi:hypothetical protein
LRELAIGYPETDEGDSCVKRAFRTRRKGFLYLGEKPDSYNIMVKLAGSLGEAEGLAAEESHHYVVGKAGWVTITFANEKRPPPGLLERWLDESFRLQAPATVVSQLS